MTTKNRPFSLSDHGNRSSAQSSSRLFKCALVLQLALTGWGCTAQVAEDEESSAELEGTTQALKVKIPFAPPDLAVSLNVPAEILQGMSSGQAGLVEIRVDNTLTPTRMQGPLGPIMGGSAVNGAEVVVNFPGLVALGVQSDSGFQCVVRTPNGGTASTQVACTGGAIPAGGTATISVAVTRGVAPFSNDGMGCFYAWTCGPVYTDVVVDPARTIAERSETNNRALGVTEVNGCIN